MRALLYCRIAAKDAGHGCGFYFRPGCAAERSESITVRLEDFLRLQKLIE